MDTDQLIRTLAQDNAHRAVRVALHRGLTSLTAKLREQ